MSIFTLRVAAGLILVGYVACAVVIVHMRRSLRRARDAAAHDPLTALPNGAKAREVLSRVLRQGHPVSVALVDLDRFKSINDRHGHDAGDFVLRVVATRLSTLDGMYLAARLHGDEFLILVNGGLHAAQQIAHDAWAAIAAPMALPCGSQLIVQPSIGAAGHVHGLGGEWRLLLQHADLAMYEAKRTRTGVRACLLPGASLSTVGELCGDLTVAP